MASAAHSFLNNPLIRPVLSIALATVLLGTLIWSLPSIGDTKVLNEKQQAEGTGPDDFQFAAVGDWGCTPSTVSMLRLMNSKNPSVVLGLGDYSYATTMTCWHDILANYTTIHNVIHTYNSLAFGNHEDYNCGENYCLNSTGQAEYLSHFNQPPTYFSFDYKRVHFVALDTNIPYNNASSQYAFISSDLSNAKQQKIDGYIDWIVAFMHHPFYTSCIETCTSHGNMTAIRAVYQPLFDTDSVDVVLQAHVHAYERMKPLKTGAIITHPDTFDYTNPQGQIYVTVGTGGQSHYHYSTHPAMSVVQLEDVFGFLQVNVTRTTFVGQFLDTSGTTRDAFIVIKSAEALPSPLPVPVAPPSSSTLVKDIWSTTKNTADYSDRYQVKIGMHVSDPARRSVTIDNATFSLYKNSAVVGGGSLRGIVVNYADNAVIARSTNLLPRTSLNSVYTPYTFAFPAGTKTPNNDFFVGLECVSCNSDRTYVGANNVNVYPNGNMEVYRGGAWTVRTSDILGSGTFEIPN